MIVTVRLPVDGGPIALWELHPTLASTAPIVVAMSVTKSRTRMVRPKEASMGAVLESESVAIIRAMMVSDATDAAS